MTGRTIRVAVRHPLVFHERTVPVVVSARLAAVAPRIALAVAEHQAEQRVVRDLVADMAPAMRGRRR